MDLRTLTRLLLKLVGLYLLITILFNLPPILAAPESILPGNMAYLVTIILVGVMLLWFPGVIVDKIILIQGTELEGVVTASKLLRVGVILLGVYFVSIASYSLLFSLGKLKGYFFFAPAFKDSSAPPMLPQDIGELLGSVLQLAIGLTMWLRSSLIVKASGNFEQEKE
jgi:hypothetical protein